MAAIYESVVRPELYGAFLDAWGAHMEGALASVEGTEPPEAAETELRVDPELRAHFARAYTILEQIGRQVPQDSLQERVRQSSGFALLATADGRVLATSASATQHGAGSGLEFLRDMLNGPALTALDGFCHALAAGDTPPPVVLTTGSTPRHLLLRAALAAPDGAGGGRLMVIEALDHRWNRDAERLLIDSFGLSGAEVAVVRGLLAGQSLRDMARETGKSEHTIRNQTKSVLAKTGAPGQVDLVRLVAFLLKQETPARRDPAERPLPGQVLQMGDTGRMELFSDGPEDGRPLIFLHGMLDGMGPLLHLRDRFHAAGYRLIAPVRPGFGRTDPVERPDQALDVVVRQVEELIARLALHAPVLLGHMAGAFYGHVIVSRLRGKVAGLVGVSGCAPIRRLSQLSAMAPRQRIVAYTARFTPALLPPILRAGIAQIDGKDIDGFMSALYPPGTHEHAVIRDLGLAHTIQSGYRFSVTQGHMGFATDSHYVVRDWSRHIRGDAPAVYLHGARDPVVPCEDVERFAKTLPGTEFRRLEGAGQLCLYERPDAVFEALARFRR